VGSIEGNNKLAIKYTVPNKLEKITYGLQNIFQTPFPWTSSSKVARLIKENNKLTIDYIVPNKLEKITLGFETFYMGCNNPKLWEKLRRTT